MKKQRMVYETPPADFAPKVEVVTCFIEVDGAILFLQRNDDKIFGGTWCVPGGKLEKGETPEEAVAREVGEETGIIIEKPSLVKEVYVRGERLDFVLHIFKVKMLEMPKNVRLDPNEHQDMTWVTPDDAHMLNLVPGHDEYIHLAYD